MAKTLITCPIYGKWDYVNLMCQSLFENTEDEMYELYLFVNKRPDETEGDVIKHLEHINKNIFEDKKDLFINISVNNLGVSKSWNRGIEFYESRKEKFGFDSVCFINDDIIVTDGWLSWMRVMMDIHREAYCIQTQITEGEATIEEINSTASKFKNLRAQGIATPGLNGCLFMLTERCIREIGRFDEQFEIGFYEDADYLMRIREAGGNPIVSLGSYAHHFCGVTRNSMDDFNQYAKKNKERFEIKWDVNLPHSFDTKSFPSLDSLRQKYGTKNKQ